MLTIKTFASTAIEAYSPPMQLAYVLAAYPDIVLPASIADAPADDPARPQLPTHEVSI